jgi:uncharacterized protein (DUF4213/DUF364 family)
MEELPDKEVLGEMVGDSDMEEETVDITPATLERLRQQRYPLSDQMFYELAHDLTNDEKIKMIAVLKDDTSVIEMFKSSVLIALYWKKYANPKHPKYEQYDKLVKDLLSYTISKEGRGRRDLVDSFTGALFRFLEKNKNKSILPV